jgi:predicted ATPase
MELLEREELFDELEGILEAVAAGSGCIVLVSGEAGIGKTTLVEGFAERHNTMARVFCGACDALFTPRPLGPLYDIAPQTQGELLTLLEQQAPRPEPARWQPFLIYQKLCRSLEVVAWVREVDDDWPTSARCALSL